MGITFGHFSRDWWYIYIFEIRHLVVEGLPLKRYVKWMVSLLFSVYIGMIGESQFQCSFGVLFFPMDVSFVCF